ncbi:MAG: (2Fe-2S)-binding protein, partial [Candidatus Marinimicrobia bacterium]|nr:(2Fe-2S)-binding protein [Candidatus Neomarinimicrobiota bacterium]
VAPNDTLLEVLRNDLDLTGSKESCGEGACGSCTIHMDGKPVRSCLTLALEACGSKIKTVEGLADGDQLTHLQESFINHGAVQCGFCTPGMLMAADALLNENPDPDRNEVKKAIAGHVCRCTGYAKIVNAVGHANHSHKGCPDCHADDKGGK